ncbi:Hypothetical predicted protein [Lecanosticta acicola]|uniref:Uncharacterized protein n=1 Tax=Lecanosticta acicola TaxID=111012 RepID=A0AAI8YTP9_9PEZI|nr:Hypothetical predicted protein [Lecanosticta acicola]
MPQSFEEQDMYRSVAYLEQEVARQQENMRRLGMGNGASARTVGEEMRSMSEHIDSVDAELRHMSELLAAFQAELDANAREIAELRAEKVERMKEVNALQAKLDDFEQYMQEQDDEIQRLCDELKAKKRAMEEQAAEFAAK